MEADPVAGEGLLGKLDHLPGDVDADDGAGLVGEGGGQEGGRHVAGAAADVEDPLAAAAPPHGGNGGGQGDGGVAALQLVRGGVQRGVVHDDE